MPSGPKVLWSASVRQSSTPQNNHQHPQNIPAIQKWQLFLPRRVKVCPHGRVARQRMQCRFKQKSRDTLQC